MRNPYLLIAAATLFAASTPAAAEPKPPASGTLVIAGGGQLGEDVVGTFLTLAGGKDAPIVIIPTAGGAETYGDDWEGLSVLTKAGATHVTILHTLDRKEADSTAFTAPLRNARAVWISGGRQWRLVDAYMGTRTERAIKDVLARGGVVGGTSAGASIQASYLVRGAPAGNETVISPGHEQGFALIGNVAIDQHVNTRGRANDLLPLLEKHPALTGIGLDEKTAIVVDKAGFEVVGPGQVYLTDAAREKKGEGRLVFHAGDRYRFGRK